MVRELVFRSRAVTGPSKNNMCRDTLKCSVWCAKPLLAELNQNLQLVGVESATLPGPSNVGVSTSILLVWGPLQCPRPPSVGESSQPRLAIRKRSSPTVPASLGGDTISVPVSTESLGCHTWGGVGSAVLDGRANICIGPRAHKPEGQLGAPTSDFIRFSQANIKSIIGAVC